MGKSALVVRFVKNEFVADDDPTVEDNYKREFVFEGLTVSCNILDTSGSENFVATSHQRVRDIINLTESVVVHVGTRIYIRVFVGEFGYVAAVE